MLHWNETRSASFTRISTIYFPLFRNENGLNIVNGFWYIFYGKLLWWLFVVVVDVEKAWKQVRNMCFVSLLKRLVVLSCIYAQACPLSERRRLFTWTDEHTSTYEKKRNNAMTHFSKHKFTSTCIHLMLCKNRVLKSRRKKNVECIIKCWTGEKDKVYHHRHRRHSFKRNFS